jgi:hypothetical protein
MITRDGNKVGDHGTRKERNMLLAVDDGLLNGYANFADVCFLIAVIVFALMFVVQLRLKGTLESLMLSVGLIALALGWLVL